MRDFFASPVKRCDMSQLRRRQHDRALDVWLLFPADLRQREQARANGNRRRQSIGRFTKEQTDIILASQNYRCAYCDKSKNLHLDHMIPLARGGTNWPWNLQWLCAFHNTSKNAMTDAEYRRHIGLPEARPLDHPFIAMQVTALAILV
jgi:5-methylcytosine-specific restriction endonuclease McrA